MKHYHAEAAIRATPEAIWKILTDTVGYPRWDQTMDHIEGRLAQGETVKFYTKLSPNAFPVKVTQFEPGKTLVLTGGLPLGLFKSQRRHSLSPAAGGLTRFTSEETFSGLLLPLFGRSIPDLTENFQGFVAALKRQAEA
jgi:hypothetical protein